MRSLQVVKIGGSLLVEPNAMRDVRLWLESNRDPWVARILIAGGGPAVDGLRAIDRANAAPRAAVHWAAIRMMDVHTQLLTEWLGGVGWTESVPEQPAGDQAFGVEKWLRDAEPTAPGERLSTGWQTTSDAIATRLAVCLDASLTLLKHYEVGTYDNLTTAAADGVVDAECERVSAGLRCVRVQGVPRNVRD